MNLRFIMMEHSLMLITQTGDLILRTSSVGDDVFDIRAMDDVFIQFR